MFKNKAGQTILVFAYNRLTGLPVLGDAANITCKISKNSASPIPLNDTNPTEMENGFYLFDVTQAESNADTIDPYPKSSTADVLVVAQYHDRQTVVDTTTSVSGTSPTVPSVFDIEGYADPGTLRDFFCYDASKQVWNGTAFVTWNASDYITYRVAATEVSNSGKYVGNAPAGTVSYELRLRAASLLTSFITTFETSEYQVCAFGQTGVLHDFFIYRNEQVWNGTDFENWNAANYLTYRNAAVELTNSSRFYISSLVPTDATHYEMRVRGATLLDSIVVFTNAYESKALNTREGELICYDENGLPEEGVEITIQCYYAPDNGLALDAKPRVLESDSNGLVEITNLIPGAKYKYKRGCQKESYITIPYGMSKYKLPSIIGKESE